jgi:hypothetical protein
MAFWYTNLVSFPGNNDHPMVRNGQGRVIEDFVLVSVRNASDPYRTKPGSGRPAVAERSATITLWGPIVRQFIGHANEPESPVGTLMPFVTPRPRRSGVNSDSKRHKRFWDIASFERPRSTARRVWKRLAR